MHVTTLHNAQQAHQVLERLWAWAKPRLIAGQRLRLTIAEEKRTLPQNNLIHPTVKAIAKAAGRPTDEDSLKRLRLLMLEQWRTETRRAPEWERSLDGLRMVNVSGGTSDLDKPDCSEFIDWLHAWAAQNGVELADAQ